MERIKIKAWLWKTSDDSQSYTWVSWKIHCRFDRTPSWKVALVA